MKKKINNKKQKRFELEKSRSLNENKIIVMFFSASEFSFLFFSFVGSVCTCVCVCKCSCVFVYSYRALSSSQIAQQIYSFAAHSQHECMQGSRFHNKTANVKGVEKKNHLHKCSFRVNEWLRGLVIVQCVRCCVRFLSFIFRIVNGRVVHVHVHVRVLVVVYCCCGCR